jgi:hypothetical protein
MEENLDPSRDLPLFAKSSKIEPERREDSMDLKAQEATPDP